MKNVLAELGMPSTPARHSVPEVEADPKVTHISTAVKHDYFVERDGVAYAGTHLLLELWGARHLDDPETIERTLVDAARASDATVLHVHMHRFSPYGGVSGVVVLAESHISIHTWPERAYAAIDIFMCAGCDPYKAIPLLRETFAPESIQLAEHKRGLIP